MALLLSELGTVVGGLIIAMIYSWNLTLIVIFPILTLAVVIIIGRKVLLFCSANMHYYNYLPSFVCTCVFSMHQSIVIVSIKIQSCRFLLHL